ncbi:hypothetical protein QQF64_018204 [Cirrhinus molitorella]|uniref:Uncharacterized protein n=1 Tax=Cirrhinus molitorella TaxID=172907 RepID=A0ABR3LNC7_9TELE
MEIAQRETCWSIGNHRQAKTNRTKRELEARNETPTSESQEKSKRRHIRRESMGKTKPDFSPDPDRPK